ncbi:MAG TPA: AraC family transcriptional regulator [Thermoanaerobaculia bacterium]|nr:AraC family transcriptional regulator [Thermoanaerobaculia bacterium]
MSAPATHAPEPAPQHARRLLASSLGVAVADYRCRAAVHPAGAEEPSATHSIVFIRRGVFRRYRGRDSLVADANHVLFFNAAELHRYAHPLAGGDDCTVLELPTALALALVGLQERRQEDRPQAPFRFGHALVSLRAVRLHYEVLSLIRHGVNDLVLEEALAELASEAVRCGYRLRGLAGKEQVEREPTPRHRDLVETVKLALNARLATPPRLAELARELGCSPFYLSRIFSQAVGISMRRYLLGLRARMAAERLSRGAADLTELALDLGFGDHSHFTNAFRAEWGVPPSAFRARLGR